MSAFNTRTVTKKVHPNSKKKQNPASQDQQCQDFLQQLQQSRNPIVFQHGELNKKQLKYNFLCENYEEGMSILCQDHRINVQGVQQRSQYKSEDQIQVTKWKEFVANRQSENSQNLFGHDIEEEMESQEQMNSSIDGYFQKSPLGSIYSCQFQQPQDSESSDVSIDESTMNEPQVSQITSGSEEQQQEAQPQRKSYPHKNLERSLFTYLQKYIKKKEKVMGLRDSFKYFWRLKPSQVGKVKLIELIYKQKEVLKFSIEFLKKKLWEKQAKVPKKIEQLKICNKYYLKMLTTNSSFEEAQAYLKKSKIQFTN